MTPIVLCIATWAVIASVAVGSPGAACVYTMVAALAIQARKDH